ncbi:MAG: diaminopimelate epimerase, partial [candidate division Zixibacteria bacterium]|nr:diaminopimelate epimerase [candidate division Zixibacteria bacterium]
MRKIEYYKYHGLGNDFLVIDLIKQVHFSGKLSKLATAICERTTGVGADGLLALKRSKKAAGKVSIYNSDGSWAEKSGNGLRIAAVHYYLNHSSRKKASFETGAGVALAKIISAGEHSFKVKVSLGSPVFKTKKIPILSKLKFHINRPIKIGRKTIVTTVLSVGNPHTVIFVDDFNFD